MTKLSLVFVRCALFFASSLVLFSPASKASILASASYTSSVVSPGVYNYNITLNNIGTTNISTFWFSWIPGAGFLSPAPTSFLQPAGWTGRATNAGGAIQWVTTLSPLAAGQSLPGFSFTSAEVPASLLLSFTGTGTGAGLPVTTSYVYIGAPTADPGYQFVVNPAISAVTPEPGSMTLTLTGVGLVFLMANARRFGVLGA